jgi:hypothetical protein
MKTNQHCKKGWSPLLITVAGAKDSKSAGCVTAQLLLDRGALVRGKSDDDKTALRVAVETGNVKMLH